MGEMGLSITNQGTVIACDKCFVEEVIGAAPFEARRFAKDAGLVEKRDDTLGHRWVCRACRRR